MCQVSKQGTIVGGRTAIFLGRTVAERLCSPNPPDLVSVSFHLPCRPPTTMSTSTSCRAVARVPRAPWRIPGFSWRSVTLIPARSTFAFRRLQKDTAHPPTAMACYSTMLSRMKHASRDTLASVKFRVHSASSRRACTHVGAPIIARPDTRARTTATWLVRKL